MPNNNEYEQTAQNNTPMSELELNYMVTEPVWGHDTSQEFKDAVSEVYYTQDSAGGIHEIKTSLWEILNIYTRDIRLSNLSHNVFSDELGYVRSYLDLAADLLACGFKKSSLIALKSAITYIETSQGKGGFLRRRMGTFTTEKKEEFIEASRKPLFGGKRKNE